MKGNRKRNHKKAIRKENKHMFINIWMRTGIPILAVTITALYFFLNFVLINMELLSGSRVEKISVELALILSKTDLSDEAAVEKKLDLSAFDMVGVLFDPDGREVARSNWYRYTDMEEGLMTKYQEMEETIIKVHAGKEMNRNNQVYAFDYNYWYAEGPVSTPQGEYSLYCAGVTGSWPRYYSKLTAMGLGIFAVMAALTLFIALSYYNLHRRQQAMETAYGQKVNALAHNLKTPMMVISGYSENFLAEIQTEKRTHYAEKILENVNKMNAIVEEMLEFTRDKQKE
ncbi:MAG: hypothetical protein K2N95_13055 [Lachnospiraceae bacterium]|nr:hypothetical protein [Lachnospiraceae bacterium]